MWLVLFAFGVVSCRGVPNIDQLFKPHAIGKPAVE